MPKRTATEHLASLETDAKASRNESRSHEIRRDHEIDAMGEFEDAWEDEIESDEDVVHAESADSENGVLPGLIIPHYEGQCVVISRNGCRRGVACNR
jgi:ribosome assembly protein RRB1